MIEHIEASDALDAMHKTLYKKVGQQGRRESIDTAEEMQLIFDLWARGYCDWQISTILNIKLYVLQDFLAWNNIDYRTRRTKNFKDIYNLSSIHTLFNGAAYLQYAVDKQDTTLQKITADIATYDREKIYRAAAGRYIPTRDEMIRIAELANIDLEDWAYCSTDVKLQVYENKNLPSTPAQWANTEDEFLCTYKKLIIRYVFAYARATHIVTRGELERHFTLGTRGLYDFEQCYTALISDYRAMQIINILGLEDITDVYKVDIVNAGYIPRFNKYASLQQVRIPAKKGIKQLICATTLDNLAQVERSLTYGKQ